MAERSFAREVEDLRLGDGEVFRGEGILAITKARRSRRHRRWHRGARAKRTNTTT